MVSKILMEEFVKTQRKVMILGLTLLLAGALFVTACGDGGGTTTTTTTTTTLPPTSADITWNPNGVIVPGEYTSTKSFTSGTMTFTLHWKTDAQNIYIGMEAPVTGYIAMALDPDIAGGKMNTDMIWGYVASGQASLFDQWATTESGSTHPDDAAQGGQNSILQFGGAETGGKTIIEFKRLLNTGDVYDRPFVTGANRIMWAVHATMDDLSFHSFAGRGDITI
jgi:hypothetical protein